MPCIGKHVRQKVIQDSGVITTTTYHCTSVVGGGQRPEALLAGGVPQLQLHLLLIQADVLLLEVDS